MTKTFKDLKRNLTKDFTGLQRYRVAVLGDSATQYLVSALRGHAFDVGLDLDIFEADYDQIERQVFDPDSELYQFGPDFILVYPSSEKLLEKFYAGGAAAGAALADHRLATFEQIWREIAARCGARIVHVNQVEIDDGVFGNYGNKVEASLVYQLRKLNFGLMERAGHHPNVLIADLSMLQNTHGRAQLFSPRFYYASKMTIGLELLPAMAKIIVDIISAASGRFNKCLIMDLDNTLWGGIIGDDGLNNIQLGDFGIGKAFCDLQRWAKQLKERGIILAVCSKNNDETAREPFVKHPDMVLRLADIAVFVANWETKVDNIRKIQEILNIGFDAMVFIDDNPFERDMVRQLLPDVTVPDLPEDPVEYVGMLCALNLFETASHSRDDTERTRQYQIEAERVSHQQSFASVDDYLASLDMQAVAAPFDDFYAPRIAQLTQRSNQFNLRTVRYTEQDIARLRADDRFLTRYFTLRDRHGDHGLIGVVVLENREDHLFIDTWLMSCRVLKRGMEAFVLNEIMALAATSGVSTVIGEYLPTAKNGLVKDLLSGFGFASQDDHWTHALAAHQTLPTFIGRNQG